MDRLDKMDGLVPKKYKYSNIYRAGKKIFNILLRITAAKS